MKQIFIIIFIDAYRDARLNSLKRIENLTEMMVETNKYTIYAMACPLLQPAISQHKQPSSMFKVEYLCLMMIEKCWFYVLERLEKPLKLVAL